MEKRRVGRPNARIAGKTKSDYIRLKCVYVAKMKSIKENFKRGDKYRTEKLSLIRIKIYNYTRAIKRFDAKFSTLHEINNKIKSYYGFSLYLSKSNWGSLTKSRSAYQQKKNLVRRMFCKHCIETGIGSRYISLFIGITRSGGVVQMYRRELNSLIKNDEYLKKWHTFKNVIKNDQGNTEF